jgi:hypothetical protein
VVGLSAAAGHDPWSAERLALEPIGGIALGAFVAAVIVALRRLPIFAVTAAGEPVPIAVALIVFAAADLVHVNGYLAR